MSCVEPGCPGQYDEDGYCAVCGTKAPPGALTGDPAAIGTGVAPTPSLPSMPASLPSMPASLPSMPSSMTTSSVPTTGGSQPTGTTRTAAAAHGKLGAGLVTIPPAPVPDPEAVILANPEIAEDKRFCSNPECRQPVGRSREGQAGRSEGFCRHCRTPFSFRAKLRAGDVIDGRYDVAGALAHGGLGWIYLARARNIDNIWVVLKGVLQAGDPEALALAQAELKFLAEVNHPTIVKVMDSVEHDGDLYIVMEYVGGPSLRDVMRTGRGMNGGEPPFIPADHTIAYMIDILPALGYLHERGRLYCDFKPDNVIQSGSSLKLIDLGAMYRADDTTSAIYGTPGYQAPEIARTGPTVPSDLHTVGRTLLVLCTDTQVLSRFPNSLPPQSAYAVLATFDSLYRLLERATAANPVDRFQSADEMIDQLTGVLREVVARESGKTVAGVSANFTAEVRGSLTDPDWRTLPLPLVDLDDPAAPYLATLSGLDDAALIDALSRIPEQTVEVQLQTARAHLDAAELDAANAVLDRLVAGGSRDWRLWWSRGLHALAAEHPAAASEAFASIYRLLPGELAPKLALGVAAESNGDMAGAAAWYEIVARTDPWFLTASFGLARCRLATDDVSGAIAAYERVPETSAAYVDAQVASTEVMLAHATRVADVQDAARVLDRLTLEPARRDRLAAGVLESALPLLETNGVGGSPGSLLGYELSELGLRTGLERAYRSLAKVAPSASERIRLVDHANHVRPRTLT